MSSSCQHCQHRKQVPAASLAYLPLAQAAALHLQPPQTSPRQWLPLPHQLLTHRAVLQSGVQRLQGQGQVLLQLCLELLLQDSSSLVDLLVLQRRLSRSRLREMATAHMPQMCQQLHCQQLASSRLLTGQPHLRPLVLLPVAQLWVQAPQQANQQLQCPPSTLVLLVV